MARFMDHALNGQQEADQNMNAAPAVPPVLPDQPTPTPAAAPAADVPVFSDLGASFNDATRALAGGLWQTAVEEAGQGTGSIHRYVNDLTNVQNGLQAEINAKQFTGDTLNHVNAVLADITTAISAANASLNGGAAANEAALRNAHLDILNLVNTDASLKALANGGFTPAPAALPDGTHVAFNPHATFAEVGNIFNDLADKSLGGFNADNKDAALNDVNVAIKDLQHLLQTDHTDFQNLTGIHAQTIVNQLELEKTYINDAVSGQNPVIGARGSNDNILDIIDIVQGDDNLAALAHGGFAPFPDALNPTPKYLDNAAQTQFWANFMAQSNSLGQQAVALVGGHDAQAISALINDLNAFETNATKFAASQGGIFEARFDNELLGNTSTLGAEVSAMIKGLQTGDAALVAAAADEMHANAADVSGNNIPNTGGTYNPNGLTVADVLSTAGSTAVAAASPAAPAAPGPAAQTPAPASTPPAGPAVADAGNHAPVDPATLHDAQSPVADMAHHFHHMWG